MATMNVSSRGGGCWHCGNQPVEHSCSANGCVCTGCEASITAPEPDVISALLGLATIACTCSATACGTKPAPGRTSISTSASSVSSGAPLGGFDTDARSRCAEMGGLTELARSL